MPIPFTQSGVWLCLWLTLLLAGCGGSGYPKQWAPLAETPRNQCPDITGTYFIADRVAYLALAGGHFYESSPRHWSIMNIAGNPQAGLQVMLYESQSGVPMDKPVKLNNGGEYRCTDGWLDMAWPGGISMRGEEDDPNDSRLMEKSLSFAKNSAGELVIRTNTAHWQGFPVWCGDGCKYVPIPFTREESWQWGKWAASAVPVLAQVAAVSVARDPLAGPDPDKDAPADETPAGRITRQLKAIAPLGVRILHVRLLSSDSNGERWTSRFYGDVNDLVAMHQALLESAVFGDLLVQPVTEREGPLKSIDFSFVTQGSRTASKEKAVREQAALEQRQQLRAEEERVIALLVKTLPKGAALTYFETVDGVLQARVQCPDAALVYSVVVNASASGHFSSVGIKSQQTDQWGRVTAEITLAPRD